MSDQFLLCPVCQRVEWVSSEDPDSSFDQMLNHIRFYHPDEDQAPEALWPRIQLRGAP